MRGSGVGFRVWGAGCRVEGLGLDTVQCARKSTFGSGIGVGVWGVELRVHVRVEAVTRRSVEV